MDIIVTRAGLEGVLNLLRSSYNCDSTDAEVRGTVPHEELLGAAITLLHNFIDAQAVGPVWLAGLNWCDQTELNIEEIEEGLDVLDRPERQ